MKQDEPAVGYPVQYASDVVLRDGSTLHLRPVRKTDAPAILELLQTLSPDSLYQRFMTVPKLDLAKAERFADVDYENEFALVGEYGGAIRALAGYYRDATAPERAEAAFTIADSLQGRGVGTRLLERLAEIARAHGVSTFDAYVLGSNRKMMDVFLESGFQLTRQLEGGVFHVRLSIEQTPAYEARALERAQHAAAASMRTFFEPRVVAVIGANRERGRIGSEIFENLRRSAFTGRLVPVNPGADSLDGVPAVARVTDVDGPVDLSVIVVPAARVASVVDDCIAKGVRALVVISAGFAETGADGRALEAALVEKIRAAGIRMIGPNCMGIINTDPRFSLNATFSPVYPPPGRVAFSTQSGALGLAILDYVRRLNLGISSFVSIGNKADVSGNDLIQYWAEDPRTDVILLYLESFGNPRRFKQIARRISGHKPIVAVKAGRSTAGARAASSHTGARATSDVLVDALLKQAGVIRTNTLEELFDVAALVASQPVPSGRRVAVLTNAGGPGILAADACEALGLELTTLAEATGRELRGFLPAAASIGNPVDMIASASADHYRRASELILADPNVDSLVVIFIPPLVTDPADVARAIVDGVRAAQAGKPVLSVFMSAQGAPAVLAPIPSYLFPEAAATALARATAYGAWRARPAGAVTRFDDLAPATARAIVVDALEAGGGWLSPDRAQALLAAFGIPAAAERTARSENEAIACAAAIGYPVALKAVGRDILHKTDVGGVKLGLGDPDDVREAWRDLKQRLGGRLEAVVVQQMVFSGVEVLVGAVNDPSFGPAIACGSGGVFGDLTADSAFRIHPLTDADAAEMVAETTVGTLIRGYRGAPPADEAALRETLLRVSAMLESCPEIQELDVNPLKVLVHGVKAVDVRIRVDRPPIPPPSRRVMY
jgi:acetyl coenzyme A synthetase (ADP forming)-like protein